MCNLLVQVFRRIMRTSISLPMGGPPDPAPEPTTDEFDLFQGDFMSYSAHIIIRHSWSVHPSARDAGTARHDTSALAVKFDQETHKVRLSFRGCFVGVDVFFLETVLYMTFIYISTFIFSFMI
jgi:hypothetical protein